ncbi:MAG: hypothetical protein DCC71_00900 [Proteobacteria bacterium]|nr:MAG: hypothetical protein DCC71_00900 [Pseudomonadota bacterium]
MRRRRDRYAGFLYPARPAQSLAKRGDADLDRRRWIAKKVARAALAFGAWGTGAVALRARLGAGARVRALTYHRFGDLPRDPWCVPQRDFDAQMRSLARAGRLVSLDDVLAFAAGRRALAPDAVLVTIDDGYRSVLDVALPVLREHGVPAVFFVSAGCIGSGVGPDAPEPFLAWDELARVRDAGVEIGSHAFDHVSLGRLSLGDARAQAERSRALLAERLGAPPRAFAYPFGTRADFNEATERMLTEVGYEVVFNALHGAIRPGAAAGSLPRVKVEAGESLRMFELSCRGAMDGWRVVDELLWRMQQVRAETRAPS